ncbi:transmembrane sensor [Chitinophaga sp. W3I9]|uniref:FecR family protein n=1 Tax=Chitinophaga sp. W3I9 TaxID=3373924 RepID=UPI003D25D2B6
METGYHLFTKEDFLEDAFFREWVKHATPAATAFWTGFRDSAPPNREAFEQAVVALEAILSLQRITPAAAAKAIVWERIQQQLQQQQVVPITRNRRWYRLAAAVLLPLLIVTAWFLLRPEKMNKVVSAYGQQLRVTLPDSSVVILNAHSELSYYNWKDGKREVWLQGEALFNVSRRATPSFTVHAGKVQVEVLGTIFNVKERRDKVEVFLKEGKVKVSAAKGTASLILQPEEQADYDAGKGLLRKAVAKKEVALAWTESKMQLQQTAVKDIINTLQDTYGFTIIIEDTTVANRTIDGVLPLNNVNNVLFELSAILNMKIEKNNDTLTFKSAGQRGF